MKAVTLVLLHYVLELLHWLVSAKAEASKSKPWVVYCSKAFAKYYEEAGEDEMMEIELRTFGGTVVERIEHKL